MANSKKKNVNLSFPIRGIQEVGGHADQAAQSTFDAKNVVPFDSAEGRLRGGRRKGLEPVSQSLGGRIQFIDGIRTPDTGANGSAGGTVYYTGASGGVSGFVTSNLTEIVKDPNIDSDPSDSFEDTGGIAFRGPSSSDGGDCPIDLYESTVIWPTSDSYDTANDQGPMSTGSVSTDDMELFHPSDNVPQLTDSVPGHLPLTPDGGGNLSTNRDTSLKSGVWVSGTIDDIPGVIYPRPPYNTDGSSGGPNDGTVGPNDQPNATVQGFYIDDTVDSTAVLAGSNVSTCLFPVPDLQEQPYDSSAADLNSTNNSWAISATIKTAAATPGYFPKKMSGARHGIGLSAVPTPTSAATTSFDPIDGGSGSWHAAIATWQGPPHDINYVWYLGYINKHSTQAISNALNAVWASGGIFDNQLHLGHREISVGYPYYTKVINSHSLVNPVSVCSELTVKEKEDVTRPIECVSESLYGFVFRATVTADPINKSTHINNKVKDSSDLIFVGFWEKAYPGGVLANSVHEPPKLVIGKVINSIGVGPDGQIVSDQLTTNSLLTDVRYACGENMSGVDEDTGEGTFKNGEWRSLSVRVDLNKMTVTVDGGSPVGWSTDENNYDDVDEPGVVEVDLADYLGGNPDGDMVATRRMGSGIAYYSTRMAQKTADLTNLEVVSARCYADEPYPDGPSSLGSYCWVEGESTGASEDGTPLIRTKCGQRIYIATGGEWSPSSSNKAAFYYVYHKIVFPAYTATPQTITEVNNETHSYVNSLNVDYDWASVSDFASTEDAVSGGGYQHRFGDSGISSITIDSSSTAVDMFGLRRTGFGADWVREWAPAYFRDVRWRDYNPQKTTDLNKMALACSSGVVRISGDAGSSFGGLEGSAQPDLQFSADSPIVSGTAFFNRYYMCDGTKYLLVDTTKRRVYNWADMTWNVPIDPATFAPRITDHAEGGWDLTQDPPAPFDTVDPELTRLIPGGGAESDQKCRIITNWLGRIVMAGKSDEPNNWFMSSVASSDDLVAEGLENCNIGPNDWNFGYDGDAMGFGAIAGNSTRLTEVGDPITSIFPFHDKNLVFGCSNSIYLLTADPGPHETTAELVTISHDIGILSPNAWCHGPNKSLYFFGQNGLYKMSPNEFNVSQANRVSSGRLDKTFSTIDASRFNITLCYDYSSYGVHIFMQPRVVPDEGTYLKHYYYDERTDSLWPMEYPSVSGPASAYTFNSLEPESRRVLLGGYDGVIRYFSDLAIQDNNSKPIESHVWIGPVFVDDVTEAKLMRISSVLDEDSTAVDYEVYVGDTVEEAKNSSPVITSSWTQGRNPWQYSRARGHSIFVKVSSSIAALPWAIERISATIAVAGRARDRS